MESILHAEQEHERQPSLIAQTASLIAHTVLALSAWLGLMLAGYRWHPAGVSQTLILSLSVLVPLLVGCVLNSLWQDEQAPVVWLIGLIWVLALSLWILDLPTGPNECFQCGATEKLSRTFFSFPRPSGLIDNDGPFLATWPAAALFGYAIGARLVLRRRPQADD